MRPALRDGLPWRRAQRRSSGPLATALAFLDKSDLHTDHLHTDHLHTDHLHTAQTT